MHFGINSSQHGLTSASRQMTIFYGGQAHVFDDVHPHKVRSDLHMAYGFIAFRQKRPEISLYL